MAELVVIVVIVVGISAMCSLFEAVLYAVPLSHVESLAAAGRSTGRILQRLRRNVDRPITAILSLNTIANTAGAAVAGAAALKVFGAAWLVYFSAFFTLLILLFSEVIPKTAGVTFSRPLAGLIARPLQLMVWVFAPLIWLTRFATRLVSRGHEEQRISAEELIVMARLGEKSGGIDEHEAKVIHGILSLEGKTVRQIMTPRTVMFSLSARMTLKEVQEEVGMLNYSRVPLYDEHREDIVGVVHRREVLAALAEGRGETHLEEVMRPVEFVSELLSLERLLELFLARRKHLAVVLDEFGGLAGLVTLEDVLEEILGQEIVDEFDQVPDMRELARRRRQAIIEGRTDRKRM